jgi:hypothetical protein
MFPMTSTKKPLQKAALSAHPMPERIKSLAALQSAMLQLVEKQNTLMEKLDGFVMKVMTHEERLKRLEDSLITHLECATWVKATIRFWPVMLAGFLLLVGHKVY